MKTFLVCCCSLLLSLQAKGQNLLLNPSFEEPVSCPPPYWEYGGIGTVHHAKHWISPVSSGDYFTPCYVPISSLDIPTNLAGTQIAKDGEAYVGFSSAVVAPPPYPEGLYREYIEGTLSAPLERDSVYLVEFFVSRADRFNVSNCATDRIGAYFHKDFTPLVELPNPSFIVQQAFIDAKPQVENPLGRFLADSVEWMRVCGYFRAEGGEQYVTFGNFYDNANTALQDLYPQILFGRKVYSLLDDITVEKVSLPYEWAQDRTICAGDSLSLFGVPTIFDNIAWSTGDTTHTVEIEGPGQFWVSAELNGCLLRDTFEIGHTPAPEHRFAQDTLTICNSALPWPLSTTDCCTQILWSTGDTTAGTTLVEEGLVWLHQQNLCGNLRDSFWLAVDHPTLPDLGRDTALCDTTLFSRTLQAPPGMDVYQWTTGETTAEILVGQPGLYAVEVRNTCGAFHDSILIKDLRQVKLRLTEDTTLCLVSPLHLTANPEFDSYQWSVGDQTNAITITGYGTYHMTATNACGDQHGTITVSEGNLPLLSVASPLEIYLGDSVLVQTEVFHDRPLSFVWTPWTNLSCSDCPEPFARPFQTTEYVLRVEDDLNCAASAPLHITVLDARRVYVPNVFSPNENGENDELAIALGLGVERVRLARVYDRWGALVAERKDLPFAPSVSIWDGFFNGKAALPGVYAVAVEVLFLDGETRWFYGDVTLLR